MLTWIDFSGVEVVPRRLVKTLFKATQVSHLHVSVVNTRLQLQRLSISLFGTDQITGLFASVTQLHPNIGALRPELQGLGI